MFGFANGGVREKEGVRAQLQILMKRNRMGGGGMCSGCDLGRGPWI